MLALVEPRALERHGHPLGHELGEVDLVVQEGVAPPQGDHGAGGRVGRAQRHRHRCGEHHVRRLLGHRAVIAQERGLGQPARAGARGQLQRRVGGELVGEGVAARDVGAGLARLGAARLDHQRDPLGAQHLGHRVGDRVQQLVRGHVVGRGLGQALHAAQALGAVLGGQSVALRGNELAPMALGPPALDGVADRPPQELAVGAALDQVVLRAGVHGLERQRIVGVPAEHDDGHLRRRLEHGEQRLQAAGIGQLEVQQHAVGAGRPAPRDAGQALGQVASTLDLPSGRAHERLDQGGVGGAVLDEEQVDGGGFRARDGADPRTTPTGGIRYEALAGRGDRMYLDRDPLRGRRMISLTLPRSCDAAGLARTAIAPLGAGLAPDRRADLNLLVSELVNNAVVHGSGRIELQLERRRDAVWAQVTDEGPGFEAALNAVRHPQAGGWGLRLLDSLSDRWGMAESSTRVWFELPVM